MPISCISGNLKGNGYKGNKRGSNIPDHHQRAHANSKIRSVMFQNITTKEWWENFGTNKVQAILQYLDGKKITIWIE